MRNIFIKKAMAQREFQQAKDIARFSLIEPDFAITSNDMAYLFDKWLLPLIPIKIPQEEQSQYIRSAFENNILPKMPPSIEVATSTECTRRCKSCIQGYQEIGQQIMSWGVWQETLSQLEQVFSEKRNDRPVVHLHWYNEPLKETGIIDRLKDLKEHSIDYVVLITNGDLANQDNLQQLSENTTLTIISAKSKRVYERFAHLNETGVNIACIDHSIYHDSISGFNRGGAVFNYKTDKPVKCLKGLNLQVDYNGDIYLCCNDMAKNYIAGNIMQNKLMRVWNSNETMRMRKALIQGTFTGKPCDTCTHNYK